MRILATFGRFYLLYDTNISAHIINLDSTTPVRVLIELGWFYLSYNPSRLSVRCEEVFGISLGHFYLGYYSQEGWCWGRLDESGALY